MRAAIYYGNDDLRIKEIDTPKISPGEVLMRVEASGICGSDIMEWYRIDRVPLVLGHEVAGVIVAVGAGVKDFKAGDRICAAHHVPCNECHFCESGHHTVCETLRRTNFDPGGFAEFIRIPAINVKEGIFKLSDSISFEEATFVEPLACVLRGQRAIGVGAKKFVLIVGSGMAGLLHLKLAKFLGVSSVVTTDTGENRLEAARRFGADKAINAKDYTPDLIRKMNDGRLADVVIICAGATSAMEQALKSAERGGTILFFAPTEKGETIPLSVNDLFWRTWGTY